MAENMELNIAQEIAKGINSAVGNLDGEIIDFLAKKGFTDISVHFGQFRSDKSRIDDFYNKRLFSLYIDARLPEPDSQ